MTTTSLTGPPGSPLPLDEELQRFERLAADLSHRFITARSGDVSREIVAALQEVVEIMDVDRSTLLEFTTEGILEDTSHFWCRPGIPSVQQTGLAPLTWYFESLRSGRDVVLGRLEEELPPEAAAEAHYVLESGMKSHLCVPVSVGGERVCALGVATFRRHRAWPPALVARVRLIAELLALVLNRERQELALKASLAEIEKLNARLKAENLYLQEAIKSQHDFDHIVGSSPLLRKALDRVELVASTQSTVLILGETGTGKELIARALHARSGRRDRPLVTLNCAALPSTLIESELFGHEKGAFTGAATARQGRFELADRGTLFLDEIAEMPLDLQSKLLRVVQDGTFERVGSSTTRRVDVRLVVATNQNLEKAALDGRFRRDLYYRVSVFPIELPPLRERREDIPELVLFLLHHRQGELGRKIERVPRRAMERLQAYHWPANVRELENVIERAIIHSRGATLELDETFQTTAERGYFLERPRSLHAVEREHIRSVLRECGWRINGPGNAAEQLGLHPNPLRFRLKKLGLARPPR